MEQKELGSQVMSKASRTVPAGGEMLHDGGMGSVGASVAAGSVGSGPGIGKVNLAKPGSVFPVKKKKTYTLSINLSASFKARSKKKNSFEKVLGFKGVQNGAKPQFMQTSNLHLKITTDYGM